MEDMNKSPMSADIPNGAGAAAILAAGIGCAALGVFALLDDTFKGINAFFTFYGPTGGLSGVSTSAIVVWLASWFMLEQMWGNRDVAVARISAVAFLLLAVGFALTFPPMVDLLQGK